MDRLSFVFSLLLIVSVTTAFGSVIKAKNPTEEVKKWTYVSLENFHGIFGPFSYLESSIFHAETGFAREVKLNWPQFL